MTIEPGYIIRPFGPVIYKNKVSEQLRQVIIDAAENSEIENNHLLAGNIDREVAFHMEVDTVNELQEHLGDCLIQMGKVGLYQPPVDHELDGIELDRPWVNVQRKGEWNPPHIHAGDFSCVIYAQVPQELKDEWKHPTQRGRNPTGGMIEWQYGQWAPHNNHTFGPIPPEEGDIYLFPAWLIHYVYPFTSDVERISFSTNFFLHYGPKKDNS
jgi:uncharacterized protein (TIGR02466 family)